MTTWRDLLKEATARLRSPHEAHRIVERASGLEVGEYYSGLDEAAPDRARSHFEAMMERRAAGEPLQYVLGAWAFRTVDLMVDRRVLIPRPETEAVVEAALGELRRLRPKRPTVVDLGTGSGAIALSVAREVPGAEVWGTDRSADALAVARANVAGLGKAGTGVRLAEGDWFEALPAVLRGRIDLVVSNPPYVAHNEVPDLPPEVAGWEPLEALVAGPTGLEEVEAIVDQAPRWLRRPGALVVEVAPRQARPAVALAYEAGFVEAEFSRDLAGRPRALVARTGGDGDGPSEVGLA